MKLSYNFNWERDFGDLTPIIHQIISAWLSIDWFVSSSNQKEERAKEHVARHIQLAHQHKAALYSERLSVLASRGCWDEFAALCEQVRTQQGWDWKYSALKKLCAEHSARHGWSLKQQKVYSPEIFLGRSPMKELFLCLNENIVLWGFSPSLDAEAAVLACRAHEHDATRRASDAGWYMSYANMDATHCIEWQLAENNTDLDNNPFWPLIQCYAEGFLPFSTSRDEMRLFSF
jgi:hypothetical protein